MEFFRECFKQAAVAAGVGESTPYDLRHGGASGDAAHGETMSTIQGRGRFKQLTSVQRYKKHGLMQQAYSTSSPETRAFANWCYQNVELMLAKLERILPIPYM